jgi:hypothetical protein
MKNKREFTTLFFTGYTVECKWFFIEKVIGYKKPELF